MRTDRINFLDLHFDRLSFQEVLGALQRVGDSKRYAYVVTPNVDHLVRVHREPHLRELYNAADLCLCDSRILRFLARLRGIDLPLVAGSDLASALFNQVIKPGDRIAVVGGTADFLNRLRTKFPAVEFLHHAPPMGLRHNLAAQRDTAEFLAHAGARFGFIAVGSPQQEIIAKQTRAHNGASGIALCIGAGLEFLTGDQKRAPRVLRNLGLEWAHRLGGNPRRLWRRYLIEGVRIFPIYWKWRPGRARAITLSAVALFLPMAAMLLYLGRSSSPPSKPSSAQNIKLPDAVAAIKALPPPNLLKPLTAEEAAEQNADRPFSKRPDTAASRFVLRTDAADRERALTCLTQAVYYEAAGEGVDGGRAVAQVVLNRMRHPGYPASVCGVVYQGAERPSGCQFTFACDGSLLRVPAASLWGRSRKIAEDALAGKVFAPIGHATHYHADYVLPYWADSLDKTVQVGRHIFYRLRGTLGDSRSFFQRYAGNEPELPKPQTEIVAAVPDATDQLASALASDAVKGATPDVEKAASGSSGLLADAAPAKLIADEVVPIIERKKSKTSSDCSTAGDGKKLIPLRSTDMRVSATASAC